MLGSARAAVCAMIVDMARDELLIFYRYLSSWLRGEEAAEAPGEVRLRDHGAALPLNDRVASSSRKTSRTEDVADVKHGELMERRAMAAPRRLSAAQKLEQDTASYSWPTCTNRFPYARTALDSGRDRKSLSCMSISTYTDLHWFTTTSRTHGIEAPGSLFSKYYVCTWIVDGRKQFRSCAERMAAYSGGVLCQSQFHPKAPTDIIELGQSMGSMCPSRSCGVSVFLSLVRPVRRTCPAESYDKGRMRPLSNPVTLPIASADVQHVRLSPCIGVDKECFRGLAAGLALSKGEYGSFSI